jgi:hypothetical protein
MVIVEKGSQRRLPFFLDEKFVLLTGKDAKSEKRRRSSYRAILFS